MSELQTAQLPIATPTLAEIAHLEKLYTLRESKQVLEFIEKYPFLVSLLLEAPDKINIYFPDTPLILEVDIDPEASSIDDEELALYIASEIDADESVDKLAELDKGWWNQAQSRSQDKLFINLGY